MGNDKNTIQTIKHEDGEYTTILNCKGNELGESLAFIISEVIENCADIEYAQVYIDACVKAGIELGKKKRIKK